MPNAALQGLYTNDLATRQQGFEAARVLNFQVKVCWFWQETQGTEQGQQRNHGRSRRRDRRPNNRSQCLKQNHTIEQDAD